MCNNYIKYLLLISLSLIVGKVNAQDTLIFLNGYVNTLNCYNGCYGYIFDEGLDTGYYHNNTEAIIVMNCDPGDIVQIQGSYETEYNYDILTIYEGDNISGTVIGTFSGSGTVNITSRHGMVTLVFHSDGSLVNPGFELTYTITNNPCSNYVYNLSSHFLKPTSVLLNWSSTSASGPFHITYGASDTTVYADSCRFNNLTPNQSYNFVVTPMNSNSPYCADSILLHTPCFKAKVNGNRSLCGNDNLILTADSASSYEWSTGATTRSITVTDTGWYQLIAFTNGGCGDTLDFHVHGKQLLIEFNTPYTMCPGETAEISVGLDEGRSVHVLRGESTLSESQRTFLPDGIYCEPNGCSYRSELEFSGFESNAMISSANDIRYVMLNIEHSWIGDIYINITCPNGQNADLLRFSGMGTSDCTSEIDNSHRGWDNTFYNTNQSTFLGDAYDNQGSNYCDSTNFGNEPGIGWRYCWSNCNDHGYSYAADDGRIYRAANSHLLNSSYGYTSAFSVDSSNVAQGTNFYHPDDHLDSLIGCPMNGTWYIEVIDGWGGDNGYIFGWELSLNPDRLSQIDNQVDVSYASMVGPYQSRNSDTTFTITAPTHLTSDSLCTYTVTITDSNGCSFDTTFSVLFLTTPTKTESNTIFENQLPYTHRGHTFTSDAEYTFHVSNGETCDSLIFYTLIVNRNTSATLYRTICDDQLPYTWEGQTFTAAGERDFTLTNHLGADSLVHLVLTVNPTYQTPIYQSICNGQSFSYQNTSYNTTGTYTHNLSSVNGCDSVCTLHLTVYAASTSDTFATACDQFTWHNTTYSATTQASHTIYNGNHLGCDSTITLHLTIHNTTYFDSSAIACDSYSWYGQQLTSVPTPMPSHTLVNSHGCDSIVRLTNLTIHYSQPSTIYDTACFNLFTNGYPWRDTTFYGNTNSGTFTFPRNDQFGCDSTVTLVLNVLHPSPSYIYDTICNNQSTQFMGTTYTTAGTYQHNLTSYLGCDSSTTLILTVYNITSGDTTVTACDAFTWRGITYSSSTQVASTFTTNVHGCDSTVTLRLTVNYSSSHDSIATACDSFYWFGSHYTDMPLPSQIFVNSQGCDSTLNLTSLTIHHSNHDLVYDTVCFNSLNTGYTWRDTTFYSNTTAGNFTLSRTNQYGCDSIVTLALAIINLDSADIFDTIVANNANSYYFHGMHFDSDTLYNFVIPRVGGCDSVISFHLKVWPNVESHLDSTICSNMLSSLVWNGQTSSLVPPVGTSPTQPLPTLTDTLYATLLNQHGADSNIIMALHINPVYDIHLYDTICDNDSILFLGSYYRQAGSHQQVIASALQCDSSITLHLHVNPTYSASFYDTIYLGDTSYFRGQAYTIPGSYPIHYTSISGCDSTETFTLIGKEVFRKSITDSICNGDSVFFINRYVHLAGEYTDTLFTHNPALGDTLITLTLVTLDPPAISIDSSHTCAPNPHYTLDGQTEAPFHQWRSTPTDAAISAFAENLSIDVNPDVATNYYLYADYRPTPLCPAVDSIFILPLDAPIARIETVPNSITLEDRSITAYNRSSGRYTDHLWYVWYDEHLSFTDTNTVLHIDVPSYVDTVAISLQVSSSACADATSKGISILRSGIIFPNVFTPNKDINNTFAGIGHGVISYEIWIYDRRGDIVYHGTDMNNGWDGTKDGVQCPQGNYVYFCRYTDQISPNGNQTARGSVILLR